MIFMPDLTCEHRKADRMHAVTGTEFLLCRLKQVLDLNFRQNQKVADIQQPLSFGYQCQTLYFGSAEDGPITGLIPGGIELCHDVLKTRMEFSIWAYGNTAPCPLCWRVIY